jgi:hypothetical protein
MCCLMNPLFPAPRFLTLLPPSLTFCQNSIAHCCPLALILLQVPPVLLPLMVLCLRLLPAVPRSSLHQRLPLASILMTSSQSWSCQGPLLLLPGPMLPPHGHRHVWVHHWPFRLTRCLGRHPDHRSTRCPSRCPPLYPTWCPGRCPLWLPSPARCCPRRFWLLRLTTHMVCAHTANLVFGFLS